MSNIDKQALLTAADTEALNNLPSGWFRAEHLPFNRPMYRCERLEHQGKYYQRTINKAGASEIRTDAGSCAGIQRKP
ncbi:hypothetical protein [Citrobacter koseri]|uniref:hypothetical protein n=1 Tax=Citrobacter koseri TaxID=545 RepID=UPI0009079B43|nr:hypothetical protein [Citrobacter koseri]